MASPLTSPKGRRSKPKSAPWFRSPEKGAFSDTYKRRNKQRGLKTLCHFPEKVGPGHSSVTRICFPDLPCGGQVYAFAQVHIASKKSDGANFDYVTGEIYKLEDIIARQQNVTRYSKPPMNTPLGDLVRGTRMTSDFSARLTASAAVENGDRGRRTAMFAFGATGDWHYGWNSCRGRNKLLHRLSAAVFGVVKPGFVKCYSTIHSTTFRIISERRALKKRPPCSDSQVSTIIKAPILEQNGDDEEFSFGEDVDDVVLSDVEIDEEAVVRYCRKRPSADIKEEDFDTEFLSLSSSMSASSSFINEDGSQRKRLCSHSPKAYNAARSSDFMGLDLGQLNLGGDLIESKCLPTRKSAIDCLALLKTLSNGDSSLATRAV